jgi:uncharacterized protein (DUF4415 family)
LIHDTSDYNIEKSLTGTFGGLNKRLSVEQEQSREEMQFNQNRGDRSEQTNPYLAGATEREQKTFRIDNDVMSPHRQQSERCNESI